MPEYTRRLSESGGRRWKRLLDVQLPYRWNLRRLDLGTVLDVGCGIGRNLAHLGGRGVGVDHNPTWVQACVDQGFEAFTPGDFRASRHAVGGSFDSLLMAHVAEHMSEGEAVALMSEYLPFVREGGKVVVICPQEAGFRTDGSHVRFVDDQALRLVLRRSRPGAAEALLLPVPEAGGQALRLQRVRRRRTGGRRARLDGVGARRRDPGYRRFLSLTIGQEQAAYEPGVPEAQECVHRCGNPDAGRVVRPQHRLGQADPRLVRHPPARLDASAPVSHDQGVADDPGPRLQPVLAAPVRQRIEEHALGDGQREDQPSERVARRHGEPGERRFRSSRYVLRGCLPNS